MDRFEPKLSWNSVHDDLITCFYRPALHNAVLYQRKAGYFSSTSFIGITKEILELIENDGKIQLITSPNFSTYDKKIIEKSVEEKEQLISEEFFNDLLGDRQELKHYFARLMGYMLVNKINGHPQLEIKIAMTGDGRGIFHEKQGIIYHADGNTISFSGSINETVSGWSKNIENLKVFCSWKDPLSKQGVQDDIKSFNDLWNGNESSIRIFDLPTAVKQHLLKISPKSDFEYKEIMEKIRQEIGDEKESDATESGLREYQTDARQKWADNGCRGLLSMATGTGKTFTAFGCMNKFQKVHARTMTVIACPQTHLVEQWMDESDNYNSQVPEDDKVVMERTVMCYAENTSWKSEFQGIMNEFNEKLHSGKYLVQHVMIFTTHKTLNSKKFQKFIRDVSNASILLVTDEVHNIGSELSRRALLDEYSGRLGLSATPVRHYDQEGTRVINDYFGGTVFTLPLDVAIEKEYLCNYEYYPCYAELTSDEMDTYDELTRKIALKHVTQNADKYEEVEYSMDAEIKRANLIANAQNKLGVLQEIIDSKYNMKKTLIYCTSNPSPNLQQGSPTQLDRVKDILTANRIVSTSITFKDPAKDRRQILDNLATGHYDCVTAVRCLDEGVDIPSVETAIIMASSGNPKQYMQRRGRVLRQSPRTGKDKARIYDILVKPPIQDPELSIDIREKKMVAREMLRHKEFAMIALNRNDAIEKIKDVADMYGIDFDLLDYDYIDSIQ